MKKALIVAALCLLLMSLILIGLNVSLNKQKEANSARVMYETELRG